jgi:predicted HicB family RNase H-like nuclease
MKHKPVHCLTLRIDPQLDDLITEASYDSRLSKNAWIRAAIRQTLILADQNHLEKTRKGARL